MLWRRITNHLPNWQAGSSMINLWFSMVERPSHSLMRYILDWYPHQKINPFALTSKADVSTIPHWETISHLLSKNKIRSIRNSSNPLQPLNTSFTCTLTILCTTQSLDPTSTHFPCLVLPITNSLPHKCAYNSLILQLPQDLPLSLWSLYLRTLPLPHLVSL